MHTITAPLVIVAPLVVALLLSGPSAAEALPLELQFLNSELTFGETAHDVGWDGEVVSASGWDFGFGLGFDASPAAFLDQTLITDGGGQVLQSIYTYAGGSFYFSGLGLALPIQLFKVFAPEPGFSDPVEHGPGFGGDVYFELGPGMLDAAVANSLGIGRRILGGFGSTDMSYSTCGDLGDHQSSTRVACDGATLITLNVPEPSLLLLCVGAAPAVARAVRRRRQSQAGGPHVVS